MKSRSCDILIIGGGIAGIAIAERLAREAFRQDKKIDIVLIERNPQLGMRASSGLEGWFHTGSLYAKISDGRSFLTCLKSLEDMTNWYAQDDLFLHHRACPIVHDSGEGIQVIPDSELGNSTLSENWFESRIHYVIDEQPDSNQWEQTACMIQDRLNQMFRDQSWKDSESGACRMPEFSVDQLKSTPEECSSAFASADVTMNTSLVLRHLAESAARYGVDFCVNQSALLTSNPTNCNDRVVAFDHDCKEHIEYQATQVVYSVGDQSNSRSLAGLDFHRFESVMITRSPEIRRESTVVLCDDPDQNINHIYHPGMGAGYSIIADSNSSRLKLGQSEISSDAKWSIAAHLFEKAKSQFGESVGEFADWNIISCVKTEIQSEEDTHRVYSYWWGPELVEWSDSQWVSRRSESQFQAQRMIKALVRQFDQGSIDSLKADSWALKKGLHFGLLERCCCQDESSAAKFRSVQESVVYAVSAKQPCLGLPPILVIPGKFSLFPSVAHNIYLESEMRGVFRGLSDGHSAARELPDGIVAQPQAVRVNHASCVVES